MSVVHPVLVDFGEGSSSSSSCCDSRKTKSNPCPAWTKLLSLDCSLTKFIFHILEKWFDQSLKNQGPPKIGSQGQLLPGHMSL